MKLIFKIFIFITFISCSKKLHDIKYIGEYKNGNNVVYNAENERLVLNENLIKQHLPPIIKILEIRSSIDESKKIKYYYLFGKSDNDSIKVAKLLKFKANKFSYDAKNDRLVICYGCKDSYPVMSFNKWGWSCETTNINDCKKIDIVIY